MELKPIGIIHSPFLQSAGAPIQSRLAQGAEGEVVVYQEYAAGLKDVEGFERVWLLYWFDRAASSDGRLMVRPYLEDAEHGVFATRAPARPNPIGMSPVRVLSVQGNVLRVGDVDILNETPLLDIKPYVPHFDCFATSHNGWFDAVKNRCTVADDRFEAD